MKTPYPWFGGKARIAADVWALLSDVKNYVEPFYGGGGVHLNRPDYDPLRHIETINDINGWVVNFWRAVQSDPDAVAQYADWPVSELDLHARGDALFYKGVQTNDGLLTPDEFCERMRDDPAYYDAKIAGWWVWGQSAWIGDNWGREKCGSTPHLGPGRGVNRQMPHLGNTGRGVDRQMPHLGNTGRGVNRKRPHLGDAGMGVNRPVDDLRAYMQSLCDRMRKVRICCGDWRRVLGDAPTIKLGLTGVFFDPPYAVDHRDAVYGEHEDFAIANDVRQWCIEHSYNPQLRIVLCGYEGEHNALENLGWGKLSWKARGYDNQRKNGVNDNGRMERIWYSPSCVERAEVVQLGVW